jgi:uncharacterized protein (TIGR03000 family)
MSAHLTITVPPSADVYFDGSRTGQRGTVRQFFSPPLESGTYQYEIRASWMQNGQRMDQVQTVTVRPGEGVAVRFPTGRAAAPATP